MNNEECKLNIGFIGFTRELTMSNFKSFVEANKDDIESTHLKQHFCIFKDGTIVTCIFKAKKYVERFDQVILSDDSRMMITKCISEYDFNFSDQIPEDYQIIQYNIDEK